MVLGKLDRYMQENEIIPLYYTIHKNKLKMDEGLNVRIEAIKILGGNIGSKILKISHSDNFSDISVQARETKVKNK